MEVKRQIDLSDIGLLLRKYQRLIVLVVLLSGAVFTAASFVLPKRFKVRTTVNISSSYFQNALVKDFVPEITDNSEIRAQRESLVRQAINNEFIEELGRRYGLIKSASGTPRFGFEREEFRKKIEIVGITPTTLQIGVLHSQREATYEIAKEVLARVLGVLRSQRTDNLRAVRDALRQRMEAMALKSDSAPDSSSTGSAAVLQAELERVREQIQALSTQYTTTHPKVAQLIERANLLEKWLRTRTNDSFSGANPGSASLGRGAGEPSSEIYQDLARKLNYLEIVLNVEEQGRASSVAVLEEPSLPLSPLWPNKPLLLLWGLAIGVLIAAVLIVVLESVANSSPRVHNLAKDLGALSLGRLPNLTEVGAEHVGRETLTKSDRPQKMSKEMSNETAAHDRFEQ